MWDNFGIKSKAQPVTLENIGKLIDQKLDQKLVPVFGELDGLKEQIIRVDSKVDDLRKDMNRGFDQVYSTIQEAMGDLDEATDKKLKDFEKRVFAS